MSNANADLSHGALSHMHKQKTAEELRFLRNIQRPISFVFTGLAIACLVFACYWSWIIGKKDAYSSASDDWENCLVGADYTTVPIDNILNNAIGKVVDKVTLGSAYLKGNVSQCLTGELEAPFNSTNPPGQCSVNCLLDIQSDCFSDLAAPISVSQITGNNINLPQGQYLQGLADLNTKTIVFGILVQVLVYYALRHPSWLLFAISSSVYFLFAIWTYYTVSPVLPVPSKVNSTLASVVYYNSFPDTFRSYNDGDNKCHYATTIIWVNLAFMIAISAVTLITGLVAVYGEVVRYKSPNKRHYTHLTFTEVPLVLGVVMFLCYLLSLFSKMTTAFTELNAVKSYNVPLDQAAGLWFSPIYYPFPDAALDVPTLLGLSAVLSVVRGYTIQSISAFRAAAISAFAFSWLLYPPIVGAYEFYYYNHFEHYDSCYNYFLDDKVAGSFGYPSEGQARAFCLSVRSNVTAITLMFCLAHLLAIACVATVLVNQKEGRESLYHESYSAYEKDAATGGVISPVAALQEASSGRLSIT